MIILGHIHLKVRNLKRAEKFYTELFGFKVNERVGSYIFLTFGKKHHDLALQEVGENAPQPEEYAVGLYHFALELDNRKQLALLYKKLGENKIPVSPVDHGISEALYFEDPDGNGIEVYVDTRHKAKKWGGKTRLLDTEKLISLVE